METEYVRAPHEFLKEHKVETWVSLPLWIENNAFQLDNSRIKKDFEITFCGVEDTAKYLLGYYSEVLKWRKPKEQGTISDDKEKELIGLLNC